MPVTTRRQYNSSLNIPFKSHDNNTNNNLNNIDSTQQSEADTMNIDRNFDLEDLFGPSFFDHTNVVPDCFASQPRSSQSAQIDINAPSSQDQKSFVVSQDASTLQDDMDLLQSITNYFAPANKGMQMTDAERDAGLDLLAKQQLVFETELTPPHTPRASDACVPVVSPDAYTVQDLLDIIDQTDPQLMSAPVVYSQESFSSQSVAESQARKHAEEQQRQNELDRLIASVSENPQFVGLPAHITYLPEAEAQPLPDLDDIEEMLSSHMPPTASPSPYQSPCQSPSLADDEDFHPPARRASNSRKRRVADTDFADSRDEAKKLKNALAAARYREKQKAQSVDVNKQLSKVEDEHAKLAKEFNDRLTERNFMLKLVYEAHTKNINGLGARRFPPWVAAWYADSQKK